MLCQRKLELLRKEEDAAVAEGRTAVEPPKKVAKVLTAADILLNQRAKAAAAAPSQQRRGQYEGDDIALVAVEVLVMLQEQDEDSDAKQVEFTIHSKSRRLYSQGSRDAATGTNVVCFDMMI
jgi:hypothetical protein